MCASVALVAFRYASPSILLETSLVSCGMAYNGHETINGKGAVFKLYMQLTYVHAVKRSQCSNEGGDMISYTHALTHAQSDDNFFRSLTEHTNTH